MYHVFIYMHAWCELLQATWLFVVVLVLWIIFRALINSLVCLFLCRIDFSGFDFRRGVHICKKSFEMI